MFALSLHMSVLVRAAGFEIREILKFPRQNRFLFPTISKVQSKKTQKVEILNLNTQNWLLTYPKRVRNPVILRRLYLLYRSACWQSLALCWHIISFQKHNITMLAIVRKVDQQEPISSWSAQQVSSLCEIHSLCFFPLWSALILCEFVPNVPNILHNSVHKA